MPTSILDLLTQVPNPIPVNAIPYWNGCDRTLITMPENGLMTCEDVLTCITGGFITGLFTSSDNSILFDNGSIVVNPIVLQSLINVTLVDTILTIGGTSVDLNDAIQAAYFTISDGSNSTQINFSALLTVVGTDGLTFTVPANNVIQIGLPTPRQHMQVLTWNEDTGEAYWENNQCCAQTLSFDTATNILCISGTNCVDLTSINTDNQELLLSGNILTITQLINNVLVPGVSVDLTNVNEHTLGISVNPITPTSTNDLTIYGSDSLPNGLVVDLTNVNEHTLSLNGNMLAILGSDGLSNAIVDLSQVNQHELALYGAWTCDPADVVEIAIEDSTGVEINRVTIPRPAIACCDDVMDCSGIQQIIADIVTLTNRVIAAEDAIQLLQRQLV